VRALILTLIVVPLLLTAGPTMASGSDDRTEAVWTTGSGRPATFAGVVEAAVGARYVLLGELHDNPIHHREQARILARMVAEGRRPAVVFEMIRRDRQADLDRALSETDPKPETIAEAVGWDETGWPDFAIYRPVFLVALEAGLPMRAGSLPSGGERRIGAIGADRYAEDVGWPTAATSKLMTERHLDAVYLGHCELIPRDRLTAMVDVQQVRDLSLAQALVDAAQAGGDGAVLIAGAGHVRGDIAVPVHLRDLFAAKSIVTIALREGEPSPAISEDQFDWIGWTDPAEREDPCVALRERFGKSAK